jgi:multidrug resistance protein, MATE family
MSKSTLSTGSIREVIAIAVPMVVSLSCDTMMMFTDRIFLSRLSPDAMNAVMGGGYSCLQCVSFFIGLISYTTALVAQQYGAGSYSKASRSLFQAICIALAAWPFLAALSIISGNFFEHLGLPQAQAHMQSQYFRTAILGSGIVLARNALSCFFCGVGRTGVVMLSALCALFVNACSALVLIYGYFGLPALGIQGAAIAAILGHTAGLMILLREYFCRHNRKSYSVMLSFKYDKTLMRALLRFGYPSGLEFLFNILAFNTFIILFDSEGPVVATAASILFNWDMVSYLPLIGIEIAVTSLVGRYFGARDHEAGYRATRSALILTCSFAVFIIPVFVILPDALVGVFKPDAVDRGFAEARPIANSLLRVAAAYIMFDGFFLVYSGALRGTGDTLFTMAITVGVHWTLAFVLYVALKQYHATPVQAWGLVAALYSISPLILWWRWKYRWKRAFTLD